MNSGGAITKGSAQATGISLAMLKEAPQSLQVMEQLKEFVGMFWSLRDPTLIMQELHLS